MTLFSLAAAMATTVACNRNSQATPVEVVGDIVFSMNRSGFAELWVMHEDGGHQTEIRVSPPDGGSLSASSPSWSPDGAQIAFSGTRSMGFDRQQVDIYVIGANGHNLRRLTDDAQLDETPAWSPDGTHIAFARTSQPGTENADGVIVVMTQSGGGLTAITLHGSTSALVLDRDPSWTPDGREIAFSRVTVTAAGEISSDVYVVDVDGSSERLLIRDASEPQWSPDGARIAFSSTRDRNGQTCFHECRPSSEIYIALADGTEVRRLTYDEADDGSPAWAPDGRQIAFVSDRSDRTAHAYSSYVVQADGTDVRRLTGDDAWSLEPDWR